MVAKPSIFLLQEKQQAGVPGELPPSPCAPAQVLASSYMGRWHLSLMQGSLRL